MQKLEIYQSLWAMELRNPRIPERTREECFWMTAEAGFTGLCLDPAVHEIETLRQLKPLYERYGLACMINAFPACEDDMIPLLEFAMEMDATLVNVISGVMPIRPEDAVDTVRRWMCEAAMARLPLLFETHRDGLLNDLFYTLQLIELVPEMRLCADLSHFVVDREMRTPVSARDQAWIRTILDRSDCLQGRVASHEQIQVQLDFPQHSGWVETFRGWWREGMESWRKRSGADDTLIFLCELGPPPYAITDRTRRELSDRWIEALQIREWVLEIWRQLEDEAALDHDRDVAQ